MPENFVYVRILQMVADPRLREDDKEGAGMTRREGGVDGQKSPFDERAG